MKPLPNDYSRCIGAMDDAGESLHPQCQQCRRTVPAPPGALWVPHFAQPPIVTSADAEGHCPSRITP